MAKFVPYQAGLTDIPNRPCIELVGTRYVTALSRPDDKGQDNGKDDSYQRGKRVKTFLPIGNKVNGAPMMPNCRFENVKAVLAKGWQVVGFHNIEIVNRDGQKFIPGEYRELIQELEGMQLIHGEKLTEGVEIERENRFTKRAKVDAGSSGVSKKDTDEPKQKGHRGPRPNGSTAL